MRKPIRWAPILILCMFAGVASAERLLVFDETTVEPGKPGRATVLDTLTDTPLPDELLATARVDDTLVPVTLKADGRQEGPSRRYVFVWPDTLSGFARVTLKDVSRNEVLVQIAGGGTIAAEATPMVKPAAAPVTDAVRQSDTPALSTNEPMYFLVSPDTDLSARFQLSFKYRLFERDSGFGSIIPLLGGLHFGYTQTSIWDLGEPSAPFRDTSYRPSLFYDFPITFGRHSRQEAVLRGGVEHESNGRDGERSRSMNIAFAQFDWRYRLTEDDTIGIKPKIWYYLEKGDNPDINDYRGYAQLETAWWHGDWKAALMMRRGKAGNGATQVDLSYPLKGVFSMAGGGYFHMQYFDGEGDTLLEYNQSRDPQFRIGVSIVR